MGSDHFRQVGTLSTTEGFGTSVSRAATLVASSLGFVKDKGSRQESVASRGGLHSSSQGSNRRDSSSSVARFLFPPFSCTQEKRKNETGHRSLLLESTLDSPSFQDGNQQVYQGLPSYRNVDNVSGFDRCLFPYSCFPRFSQVPQVCLGREGFCLQGNALWPVYSTTGFYEGFSGSGLPSSQSVNFHPFLSGRFSSEESFAVSSEGSYSDSYRATPQVGFPYFLEEVGNYSQSGFHFPGRTFSYRFGDSFSARGESSESFSVGEQPLPSIFSTSSSISSTDRFSDLSNGCCSTWPSSHSTHSVVSHGVLASCLSDVGSSHSCSFPPFTSSSVVVAEGEPTERFTSRSTTANPDSVHRRIPDRMGCLPRRQNSVGSVVSSSLERSHKRSRDEVSSFVTETLSTSNSGTISVDSFRQYYGGGLSSEPRGNSLLLPVSSMQGDLVVVRQSQYDSVSETCPRQPESSSGCLVSISGSCEHRMGITSSCVSRNHSCLGSSPDRPICHQFESQTGHLCFSSPRSEGLGSGCNVAVLERDVQLHFPSLSPSVEDSAQDSQGWLQDHSYCSGMAKTVLVSGSSSSVLCKASSSSRKERSSFTVQRKETSSGSGETSSSRLAAVRNSLRKGGFSDKATKRISGSVRSSTGAIYDSKWSIFSTWCQSKQVDPLSATAQQLADFLVFLFEEKKFTPSTIKGYRSAIARTIHLSGGPDFGKNEFLSLLIKNFCLERPRERRLVPAWDVSLVLKALQLPPFEPLSGITFKHLTYKCCFLLALATGRRRSELRALSISESCLRFAADKSSVTLLTDPAFLAKNQLFEKGSGLIVIPAIPNSDSHNQNLCPVRALEQYLLCSAQFRSKGNKRLFVPIKKGIKDITAKSISTWICQAVMLAYKSSEEFMSRHNVKAHEVRAIASSWSIFNSSSLSEILAAGFWRSGNTFFNHYLRSMPQHSDNLYALGPLVSAQHVIFPPTTSSTC